MKGRRRARARPWYHRIRLTTWLLLWALLAASASLALHSHSASRKLSRPLQVQVLNGSGVAGLARGAAEMLRSDDLDVVSVGNADSDRYTETLVLLRRGHLSQAHTVLQRLGTGLAMEQRDPTLLVDLTIILGTDFARRIQDSQTGLAQR